MFQIPQLSKHKGLFHVFSEKSDGNMANSISGVIYNFDQVLKNRKKFLEKVGVDSNKTVCMWVTHGDEIIDADPKTAGVSMRDYSKAIKVDGLMTNRKGLYLFLLIADCLPIIIYDPVAEAVGLIHAGWRGVDLEIAKKGVEMFKSKYKSGVENIIVAIGPCAQKESFVKENPEQFDDPRWRGFIEKVEGDNYSIDLVGFTKKQLLDSGIKKENIIDCGIDTVKDKRFFSHVRDCNNHISRQGRFACVVGLK